MPGERCPGCGVELPSLKGPAHRYLESTPSCWAAYGEVLAREYLNRSLMASHRLTVDSYAIQHPGHPAPQSIRSIGVHLICLHLVLEGRLSPEVALPVMRRCVDALTFHWLEPPSHRGALTVKSVLDTRSTQDHARAVELWARSAWDSWGAHHAQVRAWARRALRLTYPTAEGTS